MILNQNTVLTRPERNLLFEILAEPDIQGIALGQIGSSIALDTEDLDLELTRTRIDAMRVS